MKKNSISSLFVEIETGDCGDPLAWRPEGNCRRHIGNSEDSDPSEFLSERQRLIARATFRGVVRGLAKLLLKISRLGSDFSSVTMPAPLRDLIPLNEVPERHAVCSSLSSDRR